MIKKLKNRYTTTLLFGIICSMENIKKALSKNLIELRKAKGLTQLEFANILNYSDKSISKWENGDTVPDIEVLKRIADFYEVTVDYLITENPGEVHIKAQKTEKRNKIIITGLATMLIWLIATILYSQLKIWLDIDYWLVYIWSIPASLIVLLVFNSIWGKKIFTFIIASCLSWSILIGIYLQFIASNIWIIFIIGVPIQIAIILSSQLKFIKKTTK